MIYYVETGKQALGPADLAELGLAHIIDSGEGVSSVPNLGPTAPGGNRGLYVCNGKRFKLQEEIEKPLAWSDPIPGLPAVVRVGWDPESPPTPERLARASQLPGFFFTDADGRKWRVPLIRKIDAAGVPLAATPCYLTFDAAGELVPGKPLAKWRYLAEVCDECWGPLNDYFRYEKRKADAEAAGEEPPPRPSLSTADVLRWLTPIIATNYYASAQELVLLGVWDDGGLEPVSWLLKATSFSELLRREQAAEKKSPATDSSTLAPPCSTTTRGETDG